MSQQDYVIANQLMPAARTDLNALFAAIVSNNSGASEPVVKFAYMWWVDTTLGLLRQRNAANDAWLTVGNITDSYYGDGRLVKFQTSIFSALVGAASLIPLDDTIPQKTEGTEVMTIAYTPRFSNSTLLIQGTALIGSQNTSAVETGAAIALFEAGADALWAGAYRVDHASVTSGIVSNVQVCHFHHTVAASTTSSRTYSIRIGNTESSTDVFFNGSGRFTRAFGVITKSRISVMEIRT